jgi:single-strand DNA-binding protein
MSLNKVILVGYVGRDPDVRYFDSGNAIATFSLATTDRGYKLQNGTEVPERTEWHNIVARRDQVAFVEKWVKKGTGLYIEGKLRYRNYDDQQGIKRYVTEVYADRVEFFSFGRSAEASSNVQQATPQVQTVKPAQADDAEPVVTYSSPQPERYNSGDGDPDDLPF